MNALIVIGIVLMIFGYFGIGLILVVLGLYGYGGRL